MRRLARIRQRWVTGRNQSGLALVWMALTLTLMLLFAGFAVDMSNWWLQAQRIQTAADTGAHAGAAFLPADFNNARTTATTSTSKNGFTAGGAMNTAVTVTQEPNPNRIRVRVASDVPSFFLDLIGIETIRLTRESVAEYVAPVPMGSPQNKLGNDPEGVNPNAQMWVNIAGPQTGKQQGERHHTNLCNASPREYGCSGSTSTEFSSDGYFFGMEVLSVAAGKPLEFQVFDAAFVNVGSTCTSNMPTSSQINGGSGFTALTTKFPDAATRYASGTTGGYCPGDQGWGSRNVQTSFIVRAPDETPWSNVDNPVINTSTCAPVTVAAYNPSSASTPSRYIYDLLMGSSTGLVNPSDGVISFAEAFRRFTTFCSIPAGSVQTGTYIIQVRTNALSSAPTVANSGVTTEGHNRMAFRTGFGTSGLNEVSGANVTLAALGRLPIYANSTGADTQFYMARVRPYDAGRTLRIHLYDMGEASQAGALQILPPTEFASTFSGCAITRDDGAALNVSTSICQLNNVSSSSYNGRLITIDVPIPPNYTCNEASASGCWIRIKAQYPAGANVTDATTWSAAILGNPIRIVE
ncbi:MAG: pilus assembly protein TadG-related protein [Actinomycetota bacterium]